MAQTLTVKAVIRNGSTGGVCGSESVSVTTTGNGSWAQRGSVGTTEEEWTIGTEVGDCGYTMVRNADATNYLDVGFATGVYPIRLKAGQVAVFPMTPAQASLFLKANTAACVAQVEVVEA